MSSVRAVVTALPTVGITVVSQWIFNCYLVHDGGAGAPFVVDAGLPSHVPLITRELERTGSRVGELALVAATHGHGDHLGGVPALRDLGVQVAFPAGLTAAVTAGARMRSPGLRDVARIAPVMADQPFVLRPVLEFARLTRTIGYSQLGSFFPFTADVWLADGDTVPGCPDWQVIATPGHVDDEISLYNARARTLISGDAVLSAGGRGWFNPESVDAGSSAATEERLRALDVVHLLPGHGRVVSGETIWADAYSRDDRRGHVPDL